MAVKQTYIRFQSIFIMPDNRRYPGMEEITRQYFLASRPPSACVRCARGDILVFRNQPESDADKAIFSAV